MKKYMKRSYCILILIIIVGLSQTSCYQRVESGEVGIKVNMYGNDKGVETEQLGIGKYWIGFGEELYTYPVYQINYTWSGRNALQLQSSDGSPIYCDMGVKCNVIPDSASKLFQKLRKNNVEDIVNGDIRPFVVSKMNLLISQMQSDEIYSNKKNWLIDTLTKITRARYLIDGINIQELYILSSMRFSDKVKKSIEDKIEATQLAIKSENEVRRTEAEGKKHMIESEVSAKTMLMQAEAEAKANQLRQQTLTPLLIQQKAIEKWDGKLPEVINGGNGNIPFILNK